MTRALAAATVLLAAMSTSAAALDERRSARESAAFIGPYTGVGTGLLDRARHIDNHAPDPQDRIVTDSTDVYRGRFTYSFRIDAYGTITGTGNGSYQEARWHLEGTNGSQGVFSCDVPMRTTAFQVRVTGHAEDGVLHLRFSLDGAREANDEHYCGAGYYGFASDDTRLANSLELVQAADGIASEQARPAIPPLRKVENIGDDYDRRVNLHEWSFTIVAPPRPPDVPERSSPGTASDPRRAGRGGRICTIEGTRGPNRLVGTSGNDVLCGYGGNDAIDGRGGHDLIFGGLGNDVVVGGAGLDVLYGNSGRDRLVSRDGRVDRLDGGTGRDRARVDRGRDRIRRVEQVG